MNSFEVKTLSYGLVWVVLGAALAFFNQPLLEAIWILILGLWILYVVPVAPLAVATLSIGWHRGQARGLLAAGAAFLALIGAMIFGLPRLAALGDDVQFSRRFARQKLAFEAIIAQARLDKSYWQTSADGIPYSVDEGPPQRVAFLHNGILDNWEGVVWDPTGVVRTAQGWRGGVAGEYTASPEAKTLFGGDLVACEHVVDHFYRCWFT